MPCTVAALRRRHVSAGPLTRYLDSAPVALGKKQVLLAGGWLLHHLVCAHALVARHLAQEHWLLRGLGGSSSKFAFPSGLRHTLSPSGLASVDVAERMTISGLSPDEGG